MGIGIPIRYISVDTFAANETQMMGLDMAAWQESRNNVLGIASSNGGELLTTGIRINLPVFVKRPACQKYCQDASDKRRNDQTKSDLNPDAITLADAVLSKG